MASVPGSRNSDLEKRRGRWWGWPPAPLRPGPGPPGQCPLCLTKSADASSSDGPPPAPHFPRPWPSGSPYEKRGLHFLQHPLTLLPFTT